MFFHSVGYSFCRAVVFFFHHFFCCMYSDVVMLHLILVFLQNQAVVRSAFMSSAYPFPNPANLPANISFIYQFHWDFPSLIWQVAKFSASKSVGPERPGVQWFQTSPGDRFYNKSNGLGPWACFWPTGSWFVWRPLISRPKADITEAEGRLNGGLGAEPPGK